MDSPTAQIAALAMAGNHYLKGGDIAGFWPGGSVFNFCKSVDFIVLGGGPGAWIEHPYADNPLGWFEKQRAEKVQAFHLVHVAVNRPLANDRESAGLVGGGGRKILEAMKAGELAGWEAGWRVGDQKDPDRKIWQVRYGRFTTMPGREIVKHDLTDMVDALARALTDIAAFAKSDTETAAWVPVFEKAMEPLKRKLPLAQSGNFKGFERYIADMRAQQLLASAELAWVFGAMGSWNDISFTGERQVEYNRVSDALFQTAINAITTAVNSTAPH